jgi:hypothetical protein
MSGKRFFGGLVVGCLIAGLVVDEAFAFRMGRSRAGGRSGVRRTTPASTNVPTLAPSQHDNPEFYDRTTAEPMSQSVADHLEVDRQFFATPSHPPFTRAWYGDHPTAWQIIDGAVVANATTVAAWLKVGQTSVDSPLAIEWLPLGSFELRLSGQIMATRAVQLAVNRQGTIRGNYHDIAADSVKEVMGTVDKETLQADWTLGQTGQTVYEISLDALSHPEGQISVRYTNGQTATWRTSPMPR